MMDPRLLWRDPLHPVLVPHMRKECDGRIVNVTSIGGFITSAPLTFYNASKWALKAVSEPLAER